MRERERTQLLIRLNLFTLHIDLNKVCSKNAYPHVTTECGHFTRKNRSINWNAYLPNTPSGKWKHTTMTKKTLPTYKQPTAIEKLRERVSHHFFHAQKHNINRFVYDLWLTLLSHPHSTHTQLNPTHFISGLTSTLDNLIQQCVFCVRRLLIQNNWTVLFFQGYSVCFRFYLCKGAERERGLVALTKYFGSRYELTDCINIEPD